MQTKSGSVRTTLAIDNDVMIAARQRADAMGESLGVAISALARAGIATTKEPHFRNGIKLLSVNPTPQAPRWKKSIGSWKSRSERRFIMVITNRKKSVRSGTDATRTTLAIDNDVLLLICQRAAASGTSLGKTVSDLICQSTVTIDDEPRFYYYGIRLLPKR